MKNIYFLVTSIGILLLATSTHSCLDEIDFERPETLENSIAIQGKLVKGDPSTISVTIRRVFDFSSTPRLINAQSVILAKASGEELKLESNQDGVYQLEIPASNADFAVEYGDAFQLKVALFDGRSYETTFETLFPVTKPEKLEAKVIEQEVINNTGNVVKEPALGFFISTPIQGNGQEKPQLLWEIEATYKLTDSPESYGSRPCFGTPIDNVNKTCYVTISPQKNYIPLDANEVNQDYLADFKLYETPFNYLFAEGYYLTVYQQSLSESAYEYWSQVSKIVEQSGNLFEAPTGKVATNFKSSSGSTDEVFGYFFVTDQEVVRVYVSPETASNPDPRCPAPLSEGGNAPSDCCNCATLPASAVQRPVWWIE